MKLKFICLFICTFFILSGHAKISSKTEVYLRPFLLEIIPKKRASILNRQDLHNRQFKMLKLVRRNINNKLKDFVTLHKNNTSELGLFDYGPFNETVFLSDYEAIKTFPVNVKFKIKEDTAKIHFIHLTLGKKISIERLNSYISQLKDLYAQSKPYKPSLYHKGKRISKEQAEMLEPIRVESVSFYRVLDYFSYFYGKQIFVHGEYLRDLKEDIGNDFGKKLSRLEFEINHSLVISNLVSAKKILNVGNIIQEQKLASNELIFTQFYKYKREELRKISHYSNEFLNEIIFAVSDKGIIAEKEFNKILNKL